MRFEPTDRDLAVLLFTWQNRFVSTAQLHRAFWQDASPSAASKRLVALREAGLLGFRSFAWLSERLLYFPCQGGNRVLADCGLLAKEWLKDFPRRPEDLSPALRHDLKVVDLRLGLEESGVDGRTWVSDHQLRMLSREPGPRKRVPDGIFEFSFRGIRGGGLLEYEHAPYRRPAAKGLLSRLRHRYGGRFVFLVARAGGRADTLRAWARESGIYADAPRQLAFSHQEAVAELGLDGGFLDVEGRPWDGTK
ncbi:MAG TPA: hypothetical protein VK914_06330 [bacterium]|jgi:hypothetical protein|nr:hypothetical protein [bacterium]